MMTMYSASAVLYGTANMLARKFHMWTDDVKIALFAIFIRHICGVVIVMQKKKASGGI